MRLAALLALSLGCPRCAGQWRPPPADAKQNQGAGLRGDIFGAGTPGSGNGMTNAWDGKTDTWFDCLGPPDDFWDSCYTGIKLPTPTSIGQLRFYPRKTCPGCEYAGPDKPKNEFCEGPEHKDGGACRMVGGKFQGAIDPAAGAQPVWVDLATILDRPAEDAWGSLSASDSTAFTCELPSCSALTPGHPAMLRISIEMAPFSIEIGTEKRPLQ